MHHPCSTNIYINTGQSTWESWGEGYCQCRAHYYITLYRVASQHWWHFHRGTVSASISRSLLGKYIKYSIQLYIVIFSEHPLYLHDPSLSEHPVYHITQIVSQSWGQVPLLAVVVTGHLDTGHHHRSSVYSNINANDASIVCEVCK